ncbi:MAG: VWA domain-containing protein [Sedimentisphaerales bacterium]|nr:VWA domain-containing protein [Sedimentisphaerales bacterium]
MQLGSPWALLVLLAIPAALYIRRRLGRCGSLRFSSTGHAARAGRSWRQRAGQLPLILRILVLILLAAALARPQKGKEQIRVVSKGVAIEMVVDRSGSMAAEMEFAGEKRDRLDVVKKVFAEFVQGNDDELPGRPNDLIGMVTFARFADTVCPLTLAHGALARFLEGVQLVQRRGEDGTALGDALALAAARLKMAEDTLARQTGEKEKSYEIKSKVIIVLTDGQNNAGKRPPRQAAELARKWGITIYAIGVGGGEGVTTFQTPFGAYKVATGPGVDMTTLQEIAGATGGESWLAQDADALREIYRQIDQREKSEIESVRYLDYRELFTPFALAALAVLAVECVLTGTIFRRIP